VEGVRPLALEADVLERGALLELDLRDGVGEIDPGGAGVLLDHPSAGARARGDQYAGVRHRHGALGRGQEGQVDLGDVRVPALEDHPGPVGEQRGVEIGERRAGLLAQARPRARDPAQRLDAGTGGQPLQVGEARREAPVDEDQARRAQRRRRDRGLGTRRGGPEVRRGQRPEVGEAPGLVLGGREPGLKEPVEGAPARLRGARQLAAQALEDAGVRLQVQTPASLPRNA
jgi:hypothetical protein